MNSTTNARTSFICESLLGYVAQIAGVISVLNDKYLWVKAELNWCSFALGFIDGILATVQNVWGNNTKAIRCGAGGVIDMSIQLVGQNGNAQRNNWIGQKGGISLAEKTLTNSTFLWYDFIGHKGRVS